MKKVIGTMAAFYALVFWLGPAFYHILFGHLGGTAKETFLHPIYFGMVVLSGILVACTCVVLEELRCPEKRPGPGAQENSGPDQLG